MAKKKKKPGAAIGDDDTPVLPKAPDKLASPFRDALRDVKASPATTKQRAAAPPPAPRPVPATPRARVDDRRALTSAYAGVAPLGRDRARRVSVSDIAKAATSGDASAGGGGLELAGAEGRESWPEIDVDAAARARLGALVGGGVRIQVTRDEDGRVLGQRTAVDPALVRRVARGQLVPDATLDLHGLRASDAETRIVRFVRAEHRRGSRTLLIVHGKGTHSESGVAVLDDVTLRALTDGGAAPLVLAFASASLRLGGTGAILVRLVDRI